MKDESYYMYLISLKYIKICSCDFQFLVCVYFKLWMKVRALHKFVILGGVWINDKTSNKDNNSVLLIMNCVRA